MNGLVLYEEGVEMEVIKFMLRCFFHALGYMVGDVNKSPIEQREAAFGAIGGLIFVACFLFLIIKYCLDSEWLPTKSAAIPFVISFVLMIIYFIIIYLFVYR